MTTIFNIKKTCVVCGKTNDYTGIGSTNRFGSPDLDTRPPEMMRSTIRYWVQRCPSCGNCSADVAEFFPNNRATIASPDYQYQLNDASFPPLANSFLCWSMIQLQGGDALGAAWSIVHAAWICDDENEKDAAKACRTKAIEAFEALQEAGVSISTQPGMEFALLADLQRRNGNFAAIKSLVTKGLATECDEVIEKILVFQQVLADLHDNSCYTVTQAEKYGED